MECGSVEEGGGEVGNCKGLMEIGDWMGTRNWNWKQR